MLKKKILALTSAVALTVALTGCGLNPLNLIGIGGDQEPEVNVDVVPDEPAPETPDEPEQPAGDETEGQGDLIAEEPTADRIYQYVDTIYPYQDYEEPGTAYYEYGYDIVYNLYLNNDGTANLEINYQYFDDRMTTELYNGSWSEDGDTIEFKYDAASEVDSSETYVFELSGDHVVSVENNYYDEMVAQAAGTYTCDDPELGELTLTITKYGDASLTYEDGTVQEGRVISEGSRYDFFCHDEEGNLTLDWYVDCSVNGTFRHTPYGEDQEIGYDGHYVCTGMLGDFEMLVDEEGYASVVVEIDGQKVEFEGHAYPKYTEDGADYKNIGEIYLYSDEGYSMDIELMYMDDINMWNYHGFLSSPLAAG
ncbi:MAG: hypothetical protein J5509_09925 [Lachnospiraceae bacterium]|nr:hypothetical protein [Lachnospiraceae bacterium]